MITQNLRWFMHTVGFFSRIPIPVGTVSADDLNRSMRYLPLLGFIIGGINALVYYGALQVWNHEVSVAISMISSLLVTGALHEDGLADFADGFWGAFDKAKVLEIMKDSRIGTFGATALLASLGLKFLFLKSLVGPSIYTALIIAPAISRFMACALTWSLPYARDEKSLAKNLISKNGNDPVIQSFAIAVGAFLLLDQRMWLLIPTMLIFYAGFYHWLKRRLQGYTGDCLGAAQQLSELLILAVCGAVL